MKILPENFYYYFCFMKTTELWLNVRSKYVDDLFAFWQCFKAKCSKFSNVMKVFAVFVAAIRKNNFNTL